MYRRESRRSLNTPSLSEVLREEDSSEAITEGIQRQQDGEREAIAKLDASYKQKILQAAIAQLSPADREILERYFLAEENSETIAKRLGLSESAVRVRRYRIIKRLQAALTSLMSSENRVKASE
jgi:RNA polymerase sigma factor (sigma-70 family)